MQYRGFDDLYLIYLQSVTVRSLSVQSFKCRLLITFKRYKLYIVYSLKPVSPQPVFEQWRHLAFSTESCFRSLVQITHLFLMNTLTQC